MHMEMKIGDSLSNSREVTAELIEKFADVSGDYNPIHLDEEFASKTRFGKRIAHGMLSGAFISAILGNKYAGSTVIYLSQTLKFTAPVFIGDMVTTTSTVTNIREDKNIVTLENICTNQNGETLVQGESKIMILN